MTRALIVALALSCAGCAVRREVRPDYELTEIAVGPKAKIVACRCVDGKGTAGPSTGGFSSGFSGVLEAGVTAVAAYFGIGAL